MAKKRQETYVAHPAIASSESNSSTSQDDCPSAPQDDNPDIPQTESTHTSRVTDQHPLCQGAMRAKDKMLLLLLQDELIGW